MPSDQQTSAWLIVEMRGDATSIRLRSSPPSSPKARGIADYARPSSPARSADMCATACSNAVRGMSGIWSFQVLLEPAGTRGRCVRRWGGKTLEICRGESPEGSHIYDPSSEPAADAVLGADAVRAVPAKPSSMSPILPPSHAPWLGRLWIHADGTAPRKRSRIISPARIGQPAMPSG